MQLSLGVNLLISAVYVQKERKICIILISTSSESKVWRGVAWMDRIGSNLLN